MHLQTTNRTTADQRNAGEKICVESGGRTTWTQTHSLRFFFNSMLLYGLLYDPHFLSPMCLFVAPYNEIFFHLKGSDSIKAVYIEKVIKITPSTLRTTKEDYPVMHFTNFVRMLFFFFFVNRAVCSNGFRKRGKNKFMGGRTNGLELHWKHGMNLEKSIFELAPQLASFPWQMGLNHYYLVFGEVIAPWNFRWEGCAACHLARYLPI